MFGCSRELQGPAPGGAQGVALTPDVVCTEQLTTAVTVRGSGFTPVPTKVLDEPSRLVLPSITLQQVDALGGPVAGGPIVFADDPTSKSLRWTSAEEMAFDVSPALGMVPGIYDVTVTNPDGKGKATFARSLLGVPRPNIGASTPDILATAQADQTVTLVGRGFVSLGSALPTVHVGDRDFVAASVAGCTDIPGTRAAGLARQCTGLSFVLAKGSFEPGKYPLKVTNPATAACVSTEALTLTVVPPPSVSAVQDDLVCAAQADRTLRIRGKGFLQLGASLPSVRVGTVDITPVAMDECTPLEGTFAAGAVKACNSMQVVLPKGALPEGRHNIVVTNPAPANARSEQALSVYVAPPPTLLARAAICDTQADQNVVLSGGKFLRVGTALPKVQIGSKSFVATGTTGCEAIAGPFANGPVEQCTGINVLVPKATFGSGEFPVTVTNPDPAGCTSSEAVSLRVRPPPSVSAVVPVAVCTGGSKLTISGSGFDSPASVALEASGQGTIKSTTATANAGGTELVAQVGPGAQVGTTYNVVVTNPDSCTDTPPHKTVVGVTGPILFQADPEVVYNGVNMRVTLLATTVTGPLPTDAISIVPAGAAAPVTKLTWSAVPGYANRVQVVIPKGQAPGSYDVILSDATGCSAVLPKGLTVTGTTSVTIKNVVQPFGWTSSDTAVTVFRDTAAAAPKDKPFVATPRAFINPVAGGPNDVALALQSVTLVDGNTLTAVVPSGEPVGVYDLIVTNPDGTIGVANAAFEVTQLVPPTISAVTPSSMVAATNQALLVRGKHFRASTVSLSCVNAAGAPSAAPAVTSGAVTCDGSAICSQPAVVNASALTPGSICVVRVKNGDNTYADYSAVGVTNSSLNLANPKAGPPLKVGRRALVAAAADATSAARFIYAFGGDTGAANAATPLASSEFASVDVFGAIKAWNTQRYAMGTGRSFAGGATLGRYVYLTGGFDGANSIGTSLRAMVLDPREVPTLDVQDLVPAATGLEPGYWFYRVSATYSGGDLDNPGGESLPSDEFVVKVPAFPGKKIQVVLKWTAPKDTLGAPLPNVSGYRVYRTPLANGMSGAEVLLTTTAAATLTFTDDAAAVPGAATPLPLGSTGQWATLPALTTARRGHAAAIAADPATPTKLYLYSMLGLGSGGTALTSYEYLPITVAANGHQTVAASWTTGASASALARWQVGAWVADAAVSTLVSGTDAYVYIGGGINAAGGAAGKVEVGKVSAGGDLGALSDAPKDFGVSVAGYGVCAANGQLYTFGGQGAGPSSGAKAATMIGPAPALAANSWNDEGLNMTQQRYLMGSAVQSAFIFLIGGQTGAAAASTSTELVVW